MDLRRNKNVPECSKVRIFRLVWKISYRGASLASVLKVAFWENDGKSLRQVLFYWWTLLYRVRAFVMLLLCLLPVAPGRARSCRSAFKTFCFEPFMARWWDLSASCLKWLKSACFGANMAFFSLGASRMCMCVCMCVCGCVAIRHECKKMKKLCKIVALAVYIIAERRK